MKVKLLLEHSAKHSIVNERALQHVPLQHVLSSPTSESGSSGSGIDDFDLTLQAPTPQNGQTHSNELFECV